MLESMEHSIEILIAAVIVTCVTRQPRKRA
jgi:hypothetical protein